MQVMRRVCDKREAPALPDDSLPAALVRVITRCFTHEPAKRPTAWQVHSMLLEYQATT